MTKSEAHRKHLLLRKYDVAVPRYTSYPSVPCWDVESFSRDRWLEHVKDRFRLSDRTKGISLYIHLPFCESLCTYCACNTRITRNHAVEERYGDALLKEWRMYRTLLQEEPVISELHLGGGTPTFFSPRNLRDLVQKILAHSPVHPDPSFSVEGHPNNTTEEHLRTFYDLGFRRVSYGVQDLDPKVQKAIHRIQPFDNLERATRLSRSIGFTSVSFDLIYGLPYQTPQSIEDTFGKVIRLRPDRVSFYSYAHVPWIKPGQRGYEDADLPGDIVKRELYERGRSILRNEGYSEIGMDHFALPGDELFAARQSESLHRNFMGYTTSQSDLLIGLGASAIGDTQTAYAQNVKTVEAYEAEVRAGQLPVHKGHILSADDMRIRKLIKDISCRGWADFSMASKVVAGDLQELSADGLIDLNGQRLTVTPIGWTFIRNICSVFDTHLRQLAATSTFSKAV